MSAPPAPPPDDKDWTWTIEARCPECGFDAARVEHDAMPGLVHEYTRVVIGALTEPGATTRPQPTVWSPLEYAAHVRDVCTLFERRLELMLTEDDPVFDNWDQDATALAERYWEQDPDVVAAALIASADSVAAAFAAVRGDQWQQPGRRSNGSAFTVDTFARYFLHDLAHHAHDVRSSA